MKSLSLTSALVASLLTAHSLIGAELELKSLGDSVEGDATRKYGPYVSVGAGASFGQSGKVAAGDRTLSLRDVDGSALVSIEIGKSWKSKRLPLMGSVSFQGTLSSTSISGQSADANTAATAKNGGLFNDSDLVAYEGDMNSLMFTLNASLSLDLYRYRARLGKVVAGFRPYVGAGIGGGQVWFRGPDGSVRNQSRDQFQGNTGTDAVADAPSQTAFGIDEFINSWQWYAGLEWSWEDRYSAFVEYRSFNLGDMDNLTEFDSDGYLIGFRYRY